MVTREKEVMGEFDGAVPCAMLLHVASVLDELLTKQKVTNTDLTLQIIFFDADKPDTLVYGSSNGSANDRLPFLYFDQIRIFDLFYTSPSLLRPLYCEQYRSK